MRTDCYLQKLKKKKKSVSTKRHLHNLPCTLSPPRDMQLKVRVYRGAWFANSDRALMLSTRVYISEQTVGRGFKKSKTTEWTECSTHTPHYFNVNGNVPRARWSGSDGCFNIVLCCGTVFGSVRVTLPAPHLCGDA